MDVSGNFEMSSFSGVAEAVLLEQIQKRIVEMKLERVEIVSSNFFFCKYMGRSKDNVAEACEFKRNCSHLSDPSTKCNTRPYICICPWK